MKLSRSINGQNGHKRSNGEVEKKNPDKLQADRRSLLKGMAGITVLGLAPTLQACASADANPTNIKKYFSALKINTIISGDADYDSARSVWDQRIDRRPLAILECASVEDVKEALRYCQEKSIRFTVRSCGHALGGGSTIDKGIIINLSRMNLIEVAPDKKSVRVGPGVRTADILGAVADTGFVPLTTTGNHIGVVGAALFSGQGWLGRVHGNMCDTVKSFEIVLASGDHLKVDAENYPDLFWAVRGAGDNFGIVTSMELKMFPAPIAPTLFSPTYKIDEAESVIKKYRDFDDWAGPLPFMFGTLYLDPITNEPVLNYLITLIGDSEQNKRDADRLKELGTPISEIRTEMSWVEIHNQLYLPPNCRMYISQRELHEMDDECVSIMVDEARKLANSDKPFKAADSKAPGAMIGFFPNTGAMAKQAVPPASYGCRGGYDLEIMANWRDKAEDKRHENWCLSITDRFIQADKTVKPAVIANAIISAEISKESFNGDYKRLQDIKRVYDANGIFGSTAVIE
jgi:FAD binding domain